MTENKEKEMLKDFKKFEKSLNNILSSSSGAASWSDLLPFTKEVRQLIEKKKDDINFALISEKNTLSKRLAQCLNPECPGGVHEVVINIYSTILQNILLKNDGKLEENLGIYSSGLFPFFSYAAIPNKIIFLDKIINSCFLKLQPNELNLCLPGLLSSLIPGLDDNNEEISQKIYSVFDQLRKIMRPGIFYGTYWSLLLKNKLLRPSGIKYLFEKMIKYYDYDLLDEEKKKEKLEDEFPNINNLVVNSLCQLIEDNDPPTVRTSMDFVILRLPLTKENTMLTDQAKIVLITSALKLLIKNDYSTTRRLSSWLLGTSNSEDEVDFKSPDIIYKMELVVQAFKNMFNSHNVINSDNLKDYIKVMDQFFLQQIEFADFVLSRIAYDLILCFINFWQTNLNSSENAIKNDTIKKINNFFHQDHKYVDCLWKSIGNYLESTLDREDLEFDKNDYNSVKNIEIFIFQTIQPLKFCFLFIDLQSNDERVKHYIPIINNLLKIMNKLQFKNRDQIQKVRHILSTTLIFTKSLQEKIIPTNPIISFTSTNSSDKHLANLSNNFNKRGSLFMTLNEETNEDSNIGKEEKTENEKTEETNDIYSISEESNLKNILKNKDYESIMSSFKETIENYQNFYIKLLEEFIKIKSKSQITKNEIFIFRNSTELMIRLQEYSQTNELPKWIQYIERIIFGSNVNTALSLEAANCLLDLNLSSFKDDEIYQIIKKNFSEGEIDSSIIDPNYLNTIISKTKVNNNCHELLMGKLYINLDDQSNRKTIIDIMIKISQLDEQKFINIMENTFKFESLEDSLKFFSDFWQLLYEYYDDYPFFKKGECVLQMVDYLDCNNPLLRHLSKSWLDQSFKQFKLIVEPIIIMLLDENIQIVESEQHFYVQKEYDTKKIMNSFSRLKSLILNSPLMKFLIEKKPPEEILNIFEGKNFKLNEIEITYFHILIAISLKLTQGKSKEDLNEAFKLEILSINASSCEFLEFLLSHVNNPEIIMKYATKLNLPILLLLDEAIDNNNGVMQLQILSLLKVLYFTTSPVHLKYKSDAFILLSNHSLINCLTKGMTRDYFFVRENFINFTRECLPCLKRVMDDEEGKTTYFEFGSTFIASLNQYLANQITIDVKGRKDTERFSHFDDRSNVNYFIFKNYLDEYKEYKLFDEGDVLLILKGIKDVTFHFLNIVPNNKKSNDFWADFKNNLIETQKVPSGFFFGLFAGEETPKNDLDKNVKGLFSSQIMNLLNSLLLTWINKSDKYEPYDYCLNVNGILPLKKANKEIFSDKDVKKGLESVKKKPLKKIVRDIAFNLFITNPIEFMETILRIWCFSSTKKQKNIDITIDAQYKITIIEFLISLEIPLNIILYCINIIIQKNIKLEKEKEKDKNKKYVKYERDQKNKCFITSHTVGVFEAKLIHFLYSYISLNPFIDIPLIIYNKAQNRNEYWESWREMINFLNTIISDTKIIYTYCWMYELLQITLIKFPLDKVSDINTKKELIEIFNNITDKLSNCIFNNKTDSKHIEEDKLILPYLPHIYLNMVKAIYPESVLYLYNKVIDPGQNQNSEDAKVIKSNDPLKRASNIREEKMFSSGITSRVQEFYTLYYSASKLCTERVNLSSTPCAKGEYLNLFYRQIACITLKENFYQILNNLYIDSTLYKKNLAEIIRQLINFLKANSQSTQEDKMFYAEFASEFLADLMKNCPSQTTICGKYMFMDYLNSPTFFFTTPKILRNLRTYISSTVKYYPEMLSELIKNINSGFLFLGGNDEDKIKTLRRISFVIYSCEKDTFKKDFDTIKEKAKLFLTGYKNNSKLESEIFLMMRILFLRFSHDGVMKMIKDLWPIIFTELIENFKKESRNKNISLLIESLKFIELLSLTNVEEFSLYQWIFLLDTINMKDLDTSDPKSLLSELLNKENKIFRPYILDIVNKGNMEITDKLIKGREAGKSELVVIPENETLEDLLKAVKKFFYSIGDMNTYKVELNYSQIEDNIERDFIDKGDPKKK